MAVLLLLYIILVGQQAIRLIGFGEPVAVAMGVALIVLPIIALWALYRELSFGFRSAALIRILDSEGQLPVETAGLHPSGRPVRDLADEDFDDYREDAERHPDSWRSWLRLALAYDASGDRRRARQAVRESIRLHRIQP